MRAALYRPTTTLAHDGEEWVAVRTGGATSGGYSIGVLFLGQTTGLAAFGRLSGIHPGDFNRATADLLRAALVAALSGDDE
jgi:hypothetical protein